MPYDWRDGYLAGKKMVYQLIMGPDVRLSVEERRRRLAQELENSKETVSKVAPEVRAYYQGVLQALKEAQDALP